MDDEVYLAQLNKYPALRRRIEEILNVAGDLRESLNLADAAEGALQACRYLVINSGTSQSPEFTRKRDK